MMKRFRSRPLVCLLLVVGLSAAGVNSSEAQPAPGGPAVTLESRQLGHSAQQQRHVRASRVLGSQVSNPAGENLGQIRDVIIDVNKETEHYVVLQFDGSVGLGDKLFAYPLSRLRATQDNDVLILDVDQQALENATGLTPSALTDVRERASDLIGRDVVDSGQRTTGTIEDLVLDLPNGRVRYLVLELNGGWTSNERLVPVPLEALTQSVGQSQQAVITLPRQELREQPGFEAARLADVNDPAFVRDVLQQLDGYRAASSSN